MRASRSYRRTLVLRSDCRQTITEILANVKIGLAPQRGAAMTSRKCSAPKANELLGHDRDPMWRETVGNLWERLAKSDRKVDE